MHINGSNQGVYVEVEQLDESYLRNSGRMPVNLYKGEQRMLETRYGVENDLFNNPSLWSKLAVNNHLEEEDNYDLAMALNLLRGAESSERDTKELKRMMPMDAWSRYSAYATISQTFYNSFMNSRLIVDTWSGKVLPILMDPHEEIFSDPEGVILNSATRWQHGVLDVFERHSDFLLLKYAHIYRALEQERLLEKQIQKTRLMEGKLFSAVDRDPNMAQKVLQDWYWNLDYRKRLDHFFTGITNQGKVIVGRLKAFPKGEWASAENRLLLRVEGVSALDEIQLRLATAATMPNAIAWDKNRNGLLDPEDPKLPVVMDGNTITIRAAFMANLVKATDRVNVAPNNEPARFKTTYARSPVATRFALVSDVVLPIESISGRNPLTGERQDLPRGEAAGMIPSRWNNPVFDSPQKPEQVWRGELVFNQDQIIDEPVRILPGATLALGPGVSLIFRRPVTALGTPSKPIRVISAEPQQPWGTFALIGHETAGSRFANLTMRDGSGDRLGLVNFTAMLSIHNSRDLVFDRIHLARNHRVDDMMHIVYGDKILIDSSTFIDARSDALDIDISNVRIVNARIETPGNDAIDFMSSRAMVQGAVLKGAGDKGLSVGERSEVLVVDTLVSKSSIGIEAKDDSTVQVVHSTLRDNRQHIHAYWKNWRYGTGGTVRVDKSMVLGKADKPLAAAKKSLIKINDSTIFPAGKWNKRTQLSADVDTDGITEAKSSHYTPSAARLMAAWKIPPTPQVRGAKQ